MNLTAISAASTTLNLEQAELVNIRLVSVSTEAGASSLFNPVFQQRIKPKTKMELNAVIASGITNHDLEFAPSFADSVENIERQAFLNQETNNYYLCFSDYTQRLLKAEYERTDRTEPFNVTCLDNWIDVQKLYKKYYGDKQVRDNGALVALPFNLRALYYYFNIAGYIYPDNYDEKAYNPARQTSIIGALYVALLNKLGLDISDPETHARMAKESREPTILTYMPFGKHKGEKIADILDNDFEYFIWMRNETDFLTEGKEKFHEELACTLSTLLSKRNANAN